MLAPYDTCLQKLMSSFLRTVHDYSGEFIDFAHPCLRDAVLAAIRTDTRRRIQYIRKLSPKGCATVISSMQKQESVDRIHFFIISSEPELQALESRIAEILLCEADSKQMADVLRSTVDLLPKQKNDPFNRYRTVPSKCEAFSYTAAGRVVKTVISAACDMRSFRAGEHYSKWITCISLIYECIPYTGLIIRPGYLTDFLSLLLKTEDYLALNEFLDDLYTHDNLAFNVLFKASMEHSIRDLCKSLIAESKDKILWYVDRHTEFCAGELSINELEDNFSEAYELLDIAVDSLKSFNAYTSEPLLAEVQESKNLEVQLHELSPPEMPDSSEFSQEPTFCKFTDEDLVHAIFSDL